MFFNWSLKVIVRSPLDPAYHLAYRNCCTHGITWYPSATILILSLQISSQYYHRVNSYTSAVLVVSMSLFPPINPRWLAFGCSSSEGLFCKLCRARISFKQLAPYGKTVGETGIKHVWLWSDAACCDLNIHEICFAMLCTMHAFCTTPNTCSGGYIHVLVTKLKIQIGGEARSSKLLQATTSLIWITRTSWFANIQFTIFT